MKTLLHQPQYFETQDGALNLHGASVALQGRAVLVTGAAGSGKTDLCLTLLERSHANGLIGWMVADDRVVLSKEPDNKGSGNKVTATAAPELRNQVEIVHLGPRHIEMSPAQLTLWIELVDKENAPRIASENLVCSVFKSEVPLLRLPKCNSSATARAVEFYLRD